MMYPRYPQHFKVLFGLISPKWPVRPMTCRLPGETLKVAGASTADLRRMRGGLRRLRGLFGLRGADGVAGAYRAPAQPWHGTAMGWWDASDNLVEIWKSSLTRCHLRLAFGEMGKCLGVEDERTPARTGSVDKDQSNDYWVDQVSANHLPVCFAQCLR